MQPFHFQRHLPRLLCHLKVTSLRQMCVFRKKNEFSEWKSLDHLPRCRHQQRGVSFKTVAMAFLTWTSSFQDSTTCRRKWSKRCFCWVIEGFLKALKLEVRKQKSCQTNEKSMSIHQNINKMHLRGWKQLRVRTARISISISKKCIHLK